MISVLVPTRGRVERLNVMLSTLFATVSDPTQVEIVARIDDDDAPTRAYLRGCPEVRVVCAARLGYAQNARMVNECAAVATGDLLLVANDDLEFRTPGWDRLLHDAARAYPDGLLTLNVDTVLNNAHCCFPCLPRRLVTVLGQVFDERLVYPDIWLRDVVDYFGRLVRVPTVTIAHAWTGATPDQETAAVITRTPAYAALYARCVEEGRATLRAVLPC